MVIFSVSFSFKYNKIKPEKVLFGILVCLPQVLNQDLQNFEDYSGRLRCRDAMLRVFSP